MINTLFFIVNINAKNMGFLHLWTFKTPTKLIKNFVYFYSSYYYMKYISIGNACSVKYNIDKYRGKSKTLFFDWLMTSMDSVIEGCQTNSMIC